MVLPVKSFRRNQKSIRQHKKKMIGTFCRIGNEFAIYLGVPTNKRYRLAKDLLESGGIQRFEQLAALLPYTTLAKDMGINHERMKRLLYVSVGEMELLEVNKMASVLNIDRDVIKDLVCELMDRAEGNQKPGAAK